jgi:hypothetical protein
VHREGTDRDTDTQVDITRVFLLERGFGMSYTVTRLRKRKKRGENKTIITIIEIGGA